VPADKVLIRALAPLHAPKELVAGHRLEVISGDQTDVDLQVDRSTELVVRYLGARPEPSSPPRGRFDQTDSPAPPPQDHHQRYSDCPDDRRRALAMLALAAIGAALNIALLVLRLYGF
jgi:hypothetical protein